ncbi:hypothetical protein RugamoR64_12900 [Duganella rhizosphaerae]|uniref:GNAT family N-acetyltransferase n=1 Tax=Duganella rhizosphaerae TaxID=2885763 RepID=UPI0030E76B05
MFKLDKNSSVDTDSALTAPTAAPAAAETYTAFADSHLWQMQRSYYEQAGLAAWSEAQVPHYLSSNPVMARAYADMVLGYWRDLKAQHSTVDQTLYVIELGAGCGRFSYHFLLQFFAEFDAVREPGDKVCYVMTDFSRATVAAWQHPIHDKLKSFIAEGRLDYACFDAEEDTHLHLQQQNKILSPGSLQLPPVVIANYVFSAVRQDLFFLDKERIYEGWIALNPDEEIGLEDAPEHLQMHYQKRRISGGPYANAHWNQLIETCAKNWPPCAMLFPSFALTALERLGNLHQGELFLLSADRGSHELRALVAQHEPQIAFHGSFSFPVNYHVLSQLIQQQGGQCWAAARDDLTIVAARWQGAMQQTPPARSARLWRETALAAQRALQQFNPNDYYSIKQALEEQAQYLSPEHMLAYLRLGQWDTKLFYLMFPYLFDVLAQIPASQQNAWYSALAEVWRHHLPIGEDYDLAFDLAMLAGELSRWRWAIDLLLQSLEHPGQQHAQNKSAVYFNLGIANWQMAEYAKAEHYLTRAITLAPERQEDGASAFDEDAEDEETDESGQAPARPAPRMDEQLTELRAWQAQCQSILGAQTLRTPPSALTSPQPVYATLLGPHHAQALYRLQRNPALAESANVECLESTEHARTWILQEQAAHKQPLAILHPDLGLIGVASLEFPPRALAPQGSHGARFYFWIGEEFQWQGYGTQAMQLLHQLADRSGIRHIFSTVDQANVASQRALAKLGYQQLPFNPGAQPSGHRLHYFGPATGQVQLARILAQLRAELEEHE